MNGPASWLLLGPPGAILGFGVAVARARTSRGAVGVFALGFVLAAVVWAVIDILGGFDDEGWDGLFYYGAIWLNLIGWMLGVGLGTEIRLIRERRRRS